MRNKRKSSQSQERTMLIRNPSGRNHSLSWFNLQSQSTRSHLVVSEGTTSQPSISTTRARSKTWRTQDSSVVTPPVFQSSLWSWEKTRLTHWNTSSFPRILQEMLQMYSSVTKGARIVQLVRWAWLRADSSSLFLKIRGREPISSRPRLS